MLGILLLLLSSVVVGNTGCAISKGGLSPWSRRRGGGGDGEGETEKHVKREIVFM